MLASLIIAGAACFAADNLLANPGFETADDGKPARWQVLVAVPQSSASEWSTEAHSGAHSAALRIPDNAPTGLQSVWSQDIIANLVGQRLELSGYIKSENAGEVAIEVQCRKREPAKLIATTSSAATAPVSGTQDWLKVSAQVTVPKGADMLSVRCVLKGPGAAWFDNVALEQNEQAPIAAALPVRLQPPAPAQAPQPTADNDAAMLGELDAPEAPAAKLPDAEPLPPASEDVVATTPPDAPDVAPAEPADAAPEPEEAPAPPEPTPEEIARKVEERNQKLKESNEKLRGTHERANTNNQTLKQEMEQMRDGLSAFQEQADRPAAR